MFSIITPVIFQAERRQMNRIWPLPCSSLKCRGADSPRAHTAILYDRVVRPSASGADICPYSATISPLVDHSPSLYHFFTYKVKRSCQMPQCQRFPLCMKVLKLKYLRETCSQTQDCLWRGWMYSKIRIRFWLLYIYIKAIEFCILQWANFMISQ